MSRSTLLLVALAFVFGALLTSARWLEPWGLFHDELYYWVGSKRLELGYVDHPPLSSWILAAATPLLGEGRLVFALLPALCGAGTFLLTATMAERFGAGLYGRLVAGLAIATAPFHLVFFGFYSVNAFEVLLWTLACFTVVELIRSGDERLWIAFGVVAGLALLNKHTFALLSAGLALGVLATPMRAQLRHRWFWIGAAVALLLVLPNLWWNWQHDWPSLAFYRSRPAIDLPATFGDALEIQIGGINPANLLLWVPGLGFLFFSRAGRPYRPLAIAFLALLVVILLSGQKRGDRIGGVYPVVLAAGAAFWDRARGRWASFGRWAIPPLMLAFGALLLPISHPVLHPDRMPAYFEMLGEKAEIESADVGRSIPGHLMGRLEWERFADDVADAVATLQPDERERAVLLAPHWLYASVIEYYARDRDLPPIVAPHNAYWFWRGDAAGRDVVVAVAIAPQALERYFAEQRQIGMFHCERCIAWRPDIPIVVASGAEKDLVDLLTEWKTFDIRSVPELRL